MSEQQQVEHIHVPHLVKSQGFWWIPPLPPHWDDWMGPYDHKEDAEADRQGIERTINGTAWRDMLLEAEEEFEEEWERRGGNDD